MTKPDNKPFYAILGETFMETTFDLDEDTGGWTTIHELIAKHLLRDYNERETHLLMDSHIGMVKRNFYQAKDYVESHLGRPVYLIKEPKGKNIKCVTTDPDYRNAKEENYKRIVRNCTNAVKNFMGHARLSAPEKYKAIQRRSGNYIALVEHSDGKD